MITQAKGETAYQKAIIILEPDGRPPIKVISTTQITNLNADMLDGKHDGEVNAKYLLGVEIDDSGKANDKVLVFNSTSGKLEYELNNAHTHSSAIHKDVAAEISTITEKTSPADADLILIEDSAASHAKKKVQISNLPSGGLGNFNIPIYLGDGMFAENRIISGDIYTLTGTIAEIEAAATEVKNGERAFFPQHPKIALTITAVKYDRKKTDTTPYEGVAKYRIRIDKIAVDGTITNVYDGGLTTTSELSWTPKSHTVSISIAQTDVLRIRLLLEAAASLSFPCTSHIRGLRLECSSA